MRYVKRIGFAVLVIAGLVLAVAMPDYLTIGVLVSLGGVIGLVVSK
jgi:hypothetical protein